jgi:hypothetical protein
VLGVSGIGDDQLRGQFADLKTGPTQPRPYRGDEVVTGAHRRHRASFENGPDAFYLDNALNGQVTERRKDSVRMALLYDTLMARST